MSNVPTRVGNGTTQACAACKYQRRKCAPDCILAPYFPHHRQRQFLNAHKLFGVSNISKIIKNLDPIDKDQAMKTIIIQSDVRAHDPVGGCYRIIRDLQRQIEYTKAELDLVLHQLALCRTQGLQNQNVANMEDCVNNNYEYGLEDDVADVWGMQDCMAMASLQDRQIFGDEGGNDVEGVVETTSCEKSENVFEGKESVDDQRRFESSTQLFVSL